MILCNENLTLILHAAIESQGFRFMKFLTLLLFADRVRENVEEFKFSLLHSFEILHDPYNIGIPVYLITYDDQEGNVK
jgi:hypothetical protein